MNDIIQENSVVKVNSAIDITTLALSAQEGFLLSRVGDEITIKDLYQLSLLDTESTATIIKKLIDQKVLIVLKDESKKTNKVLSIEESIPERNYQSFIFNLIELQEAGDLTEKIRKEILFVYEKMESMTYYELLNVPSSATDKEVKKAFLTLSKIYHPDSYFRKNLGTFKQKMSAVYTKIGKVHSTLSDAVSKRNYRFQLIESGKIEAESGESMEDPHDRKKRLERQKKEQRVSRNPLMARVNKAKEFYNAGLEDLNKEAWISAANNFKLAITYDPNNELYKLKADTVKDAANMAAAERIYQRALVMESYGQEGYFEAFVKAAETYPSGGEFNFKVADMLVEQTDWNDALPYANKAVNANNKNIEYRILASKILLKLKLKPEALKHIEAVLAIDENNETAKVLLKEAKKWF